MYSIWHSQTSTKGILQEGFTNILKHAHANRVSVTTGIDGGEQVYVRVQDNGTGFAAGRPGGRGLDSMRRRAESIGGHLDVLATPGGTTLNLLLPVT